MNPNVSRTILITIVLISLSASNAASLSISGFSKIKPREYMMAPDGTLTGTFVNGVGAPIYITDTYLYVNNYSRLCFHEPPIPIKPVGYNETFQIQLPACNLSLISGKTFSLNIGINYTVSIGSIQTHHVESGNLRGLVGEQTAFIRPDMYKPTPSMLDPKASLAFCLVVLAWVRWKKRRYTALVGLALLLALILLWQLGFYNSLYY
jgi:hypothetical protein